MCLFEGAGIIRTFRASLLAFLVFCLGASSVIAGGACGTMVGGALDFNQIATTVAIPDKFPPESPVMFSVFSTTTILIPVSSCAAFGRASLERGCIRHDRCYDTLGSNKRECDGILLGDWVGECHRTFKSKTPPAENRPLTDEQFVNQMCLKSCLSFVHAMAEVQRMNIGGFCPSCDAFTHAQNHPLYFPENSE